MLLRMTFVYRSTIHFRGLRLTTRTRDIGTTWLPLRTVEPIDETAPVQFAHESRINQILNFEHGDFGILLYH
jgi:hypothetical protein